MFNIIWDQSSMYQSPSPSLRFMKLYDVGYSNWGISTGLSSVLFFDRNSSDQPMLCGESSSWPLKILIFGFSWPEMHGPIMVTVHPNYLG